MDGLFYTNDKDKIHLLRFYPESGYVIAKTIYGTEIKNVNQVLRLFAMDGLKLIGEPEEVFAGAYDENGDDLRFKIENEIRVSSPSWAKHDLISGKGSVISENELQLKIKSRNSGIIAERIYRRVTGNAVEPETPQGK